MIVPCECGAKLKIDEAKIAGKSIRVRCPRCGNLISVVLPVPGSPAPVVKKAVPAASSVASSGTRVLVAHDSDVVRAMVQGVLTEAGFQVESASDGVEALKKVHAFKPQGIVLDVGLPGIYGFDLCERLKNNPDTKSIKIVLLSSVYDMRRYKRTPMTLYGADDYIEKHHIPDLLPAKLSKLIHPDQFPAAAPKAGDHAPLNLPEMSRPPAREFESSLLRAGSASLAEPAAANRQIASPAAFKHKPAESQEGSALFPESLSLEASIFQKEECDIPRVEAADPEAVEKARRFARIIVSDIALYNQDAVREGLRAGTFYDLLKNDIDEGRELYERRIPGNIKAKKDFYREAFENFTSQALKKISQ